MAVAHYAQSKLMQGKGLENYLCIIKSVLFFDAVATNSVIIETRILD